MHITCCTKKEFSFSESYKALTVWGFGLLFYSVCEIYYVIDQTSETVIHRIELDATMHSPDVFH